MKLYEHEIILQLIATPIGNLQEVSQRAKDAFMKAEVILCEDTRTTGKLLKLLEVQYHAKLISYHKFNETKKLDSIIEIIKDKQTVLVSDAGYPTISDPGYLLVKACYENDIGVEVINGPSAMMHALVASGIDTKAFLFIGFLDHLKTKRIKELKIYKDITMPLVIYEAVHRINETLNDIKTTYGNRFVVVARELTKQNETIYRGYLDDYEEITTKGEFVVIIAPQVKAPTDLKIEAAVEEVKVLMEYNMRCKDACKYVGHRSKYDPKILYEVINKTLDKE